MGRHRPPHGPPDAAKMTQAIFKNVDGDNDGKISKDELSSALAKTEDAPDSEAVFKALDTDKDGSITSAELEETLKKLFEQMKPKHSGNGCYDSSGAASTQSSGLVQGEFSALA
jgi:Ca2+-binding EF-hand superfamily protein